MQNQLSELKMEKHSVQKPADRNPAHKRGNEEIKQEQQEIIATQGRKSPTYREQSNTLQLLAVNSISCRCYAI